MPIRFSPLIISPHLFIQEVILKGIHILEVLPYLVDVIN